MPDEFHDAVVSLTEDEFLRLYGPWQPMTPAEISVMGPGRCARGDARLAPGENYNGALRPLLPGVPDQTECRQVWVRRDARSPWRMEFVVDRVSTEEWVFKCDQSVRMPWDQALHLIDGISYLKPELALLCKAGQDREEDWEDLSVARLGPEGRQWLTVTLEKLGYAEWARLAHEES